MNLAFKACLAITLLTWFAGGALCQAPVQRSEDDPRLMAYDALFHRVAHFEGIASQLRSEGKKTSLGSAIRQEYGLTADQYAQLASIALDWKAKFDAVNAKAGPLLAQGLTSATSPDLSNLVEAHRQVTRDCIAELQTALGGPARLAALEALVMKPSPSGPILPK
jgi:hypothetical protein